MQQTQTAFIAAGRSLFQVELPHENDEVLPNVKWGCAAGFPSVSYWLYRVFERRLTNTSLNYKLGKSLLEEVGACLLGGHGIPAEKGLAAYEHMKSKNHSMDYFRVKTKIIQLWGKKNGRLRFKKAKEFFNKNVLKGSIVASDAFFPFPDSIDIFGKIGVKAIIQPGGSIKDQLSIDYCNENDLAMVMTGTRHFKH